MHKSYVPDIAESIRSFGAHDGNHLAVVGRNAENATEEKHKSQREPVQQIYWRRPRVIQLHQKPSAKKNTKKLKYRYITGRPTTDNILRVGANPF